MNICVIRHGETEWNAAHKTQGREDIPLNQNGRLQAERCGLALRGKYNNNWKAIITSPLSRAKQTAEIIAGILNISDIIEDDALMEQDYGEASGMTRAEREIKFPDGKWDGMESRESLRNRSFSTFMQSADKFYPSDIIIVSHYGVINSVLSEVSNNIIGMGKTHLKNACINMFTYKDQQLEIVYYNKTCDEL